MGGVCERRARREELGRAHQSPPEQVGAKGQPCLLDEEMPRPSRRQPDVRSGVRQAHGRFEPPGRPGRHSPHARFGPLIPFAARGELRENGAAEVDQRLITSVGRLEAGEEARGQPGQVRRGNRDEVSPENNVRCSSRPGSSFRDLRIGGPPCLRPRARAPCPAQPPPRHPPADLPVSSLEGEPASQRQRHLDRMVGVELGLRIGPSPGRVPRTHRLAPSQKTMRP